MYHGSDESNQTRFIKLIKHVLSTGPKITRDYLALDYDCFLHSALTDTKEIYSSLIQTLF